jgi:hypothetical protein
MKNTKKPSEMTYKVRRAGARALTAGLAAAGTYAAAKGMDVPAFHDPALMGSIVAANSTMGAFIPDMIHSTLVNRQQFKDHI